MVQTVAYPAPDPVVAIDVQTGATVVTRYTADFGDGSGIGSTDRVFLAWIDDQHFVGVLVPIVAGGTSGSAKGTATVVRVDLATGAEVPVGTIGWWADGGGGQPKVADDGRYLFYGGFRLASEGQAYLHRLDLTSGVDAQLVPLGLYGNGGCQGSAICDWTTPWDVSPDAQHILYHRPGAASTPSDVNTPADTPLFYAEPDGSAATRPFGSHLGAGIGLPRFSPDGSAVAVDGFAPAAGTGAAIGVARVDGSAVPTYYDGAFIAWRGDSAAIVMMDALGQVTEIGLGTGSSTSLEQRSNNYLWA
jgi:hypothetical protein